MTHPSDIAGLSERLNDAEGVGACLSGDPQFIKALCKEAATALDSLSARVKELEAQSWKYLQEVGVQAREVIRAEQQRDEAYERAAKCVPDNWCDPLLTGKDAAKIPLDCNGIERLLQGVVARIRRLASGPEGGSVKMEGK